MSFKRNFFNLNSGFNLNKGRGFLLSGLVAVGLSTPQLSFSAGRQASGTSSQRAQSAPASMPAARQSAPAIQRQSIPTYQRQSAPSVQVRQSVPVQNQQQRITQTRTPVSVASTPRSAPASGLPQTYRATQARPIQSVPSNVQRSTPLLQSSRPNQITTTSAQSVRPAYQTVNNQPSNVNRQPTQNYNQPRTSTQSAPVRTVGNQSVPTVRRNNPSVDNSVKRNPVNSGAPNAPVQNQNNGQAAVRARTPFVQQHLEVSRERNIRIQNKVYIQNQVHTYQTEFQAQHFEAFNSRRNEVLAYDRGRVLTGRYYWDRHPVRIISDPRIYFWNPLWASFFFATAVDLTFQRECYGYDAPSLIAFRYPRYIFPTVGFYETVNVVSTYPVPIQNNFQLGMSLLINDLAAKLANLTAQPISLNENDIVFSDQQILADQAIVYSGYVDSGGNRFSFYALIDLQNPQSGNMIFIPARTDGLSSEDDDVALLNQINSRIEALGGTVNRAEALPN